MLALKRSLANFVPQNLQRVDDLTQALLRALRQILMREDINLKGLRTRLQTLNPLAILERGYSVTSVFETGRVIFSAQELSKGDRIKTKLSQGEFVSEVV